MYLRKYIPIVCEISVSYLEVMNHTLALINSLRERGYNIYYLSNWSKWHVQELIRANKFEFLKLMDEGIFSYETGYMKPDRRIYKYFLDKYNLDPSTCIFFDDKEENVKAARDVGMKAEVFYKDKGDELLAEFILNESINSAVSKDYKPKGKKTLSSFTKVKLSKESINKYKNTFKALKHIKEKCTGYIYLDKNIPIAVIAVEEKEDCKFIQALEIDKKYQGYGLSKQLLHIATDELKATRLSVNKNNNLAYDIYKKYGFKDYDETDSMIFMSINESTFKRSELPADVFGIPQERKYPMPDEKHTRSAIKLFNHVEPKYEKQLAKKVISNMKKYNIPYSVVGDKNRLKKYLPTSVNESSAIQKFDSPEQLQQWMKQNISYKNYTKLMSPEEVYNSKKGSCHDQVMFELYCLRQMKKNPKALFIIEYNKDGNGRDNVTHSLVYYIENNKLCWIENAWGGMEGIHKFNDIKELKNKLKELHNIGKFGNYKKYPELEIVSFKHHNPGESLQQLVDICLG